MTGLPKRRGCRNGEENAAKEEKKNGGCEKMISHFFTAPLLKDQISFIPVPSAWTTNGINSVIKAA